MSDRRDHDHFLSLANEEDTTKDDSTVTSARAPQLPVNPLHSSVKPGLQSSSSLTCKTRREHATQGRDERALIHVNEAAPRSHGLSFLSHAP